MIRLRRAFITIIFVSLIALFASACGGGASILTTVTLEDDFSGTRVMEVSIAKSKLRDYFSGSVDELKALIEAKCPKELSYQISETDSSLVCVFQLEFDSIDTYKRKVAAIIGEECEIEIHKADSILAHGISYNEDFTSEELLDWFSKALVDNKFVSSSYKNDIFASDKTKFIFSSKEYSSSERINVSDMEYLSFGSIDILTKPYYDGSYDRTVIFHIPQYTMDLKGDVITAYMEEGVPSGADMQWDEDSESDEKLFKIIMKRHKANELSEAMKRILHSNEALVERIPYKHEENMLEHGLAIKETIDLINFITDKSGKAHLRYYISSSCQAIVEDSERGLLSGYDIWNNEYEGYSCVYETKTLQTTLTVNTKISYVPEEINVSTQVKGRKKIKRSIEMIFGNSIDDDEAQQLQERINDAIDGMADLEYTELDEGFKVTLKQSGTKEEVNEGFQTIFNTKDSFVRYARQNDKFSFRLTSVFEERLYFNEFFKEKYRDIDINYEAELTGGEKISDSSKAYYEDDDSVEIRNNKISVKSENGKIYCSVMASKFNPSVILYLLLIVVFIAAVMLAGYMGYLKLMEAKTVNAASVSIRSIISIDKIKHILHKKQCSACKSYINKQYKYCTKCGIRLEEN